MQILKFEHMTDEWLNFIVSCRRGISHTYDIVEGPMADDTIWNYNSLKSLKFEGAYLI